MDRDRESIQQARRLVERAAEAQKILEHFSQEQIDAVVAAAAEAARSNAEPLARLAVEETTYGVVADKIEKNLFSARDVYGAIRNLKTVGIVREVTQGAGGVEVAIAPTYSGCPAIHMIEEEIVGRLTQAGWAEVRVKTVLAPAWSTDWIAPSARHHAIGAPLRSVPWRMRQSASRPTYGDASRFVTSACSGWPGS